MGILNRPSDGLPSVLFALVRTLRALGPMPEAELLAICAPAALQDHATTFEDGKQARQTLRRWRQLGLFEEIDGKITLIYEARAVDVTGLAGVFRLGGLLRKLVLNAENNAQLNAPEGELAADLTLALSWALAQDVLTMPGGAYSELNELDIRQLPNPPSAFQNDTRWTGFKEWVPLLGFGWTESKGRGSLLVVDPSAAVRDVLPAIFKSRKELPIDEFTEAIALEIPVLDGGVYRRAVEGRLEPGTWRPTQPHEISVSLSVALQRLDVLDVFRLVARADAPKRTLLGRGFREIGQVSHVVLEGGRHA